MHTRQRRLVSTNGCATHVPEVLSSESCIVMLFAHDHVYHDALSPLTDPDPASVSTYNALLTGIALASKLARTPVTVSCFDTDRDAARRRPSAAPNILPFSRTVPGVADAKPAACPHRVTCELAARVELVQCSRTACSPDVDACCPGLTFMTVSLRVENGDHVSKSESREPPLRITKAA